MDNHNKISIFPETESTLNWVECWVDWTGCVCCGWTVRMEWVVCIDFDWLLLKSVRFMYILSGGRTYIFISSAPRIMANNPTGHTHTHTIWLCSTFSLMDKWMTETDERTDFALAAIDSNEYSTMCRGNRGKIRLPMYVKAIDWLQSASHRSRSTNTLKWICCHVPFNRIIHVKQGKTRFVFVDAAT